MNHTPKHGLYGIKLKRMTNAIYILYKKGVFMHKTIAKRSKGIYTHCNGLVRKTVEDPIYFDGCLGGVEV